VGGVPEVGGAGCWRGVACAAMCCCDVLLRCAAAMCVVVCML
jgi:hypothetical protein